MLNTGVVVIGSGAGGGVVAAELVKAGVSVVVLEKGGYYNESDFKSWRELESLARTFEKGGLCTSKDGSIPVLAGACVGGGTTINWCASFRPPANVLTEWTDSGLWQFR